MNDQPRYTEAFAELQQIVQEIEQGAISVDDLSEKVKRAAVLIQICRDRLSATQKDVDQVLGALDAGETPPPED